MVRTPADMAKVMKEMEASAKKDAAERAAIEKEAKIAEKAQKELLKLQKELESESD